MSPGPTSLFVKWKGRLTLSGAHSGATEKGGKISCKYKSSSLLSTYSIPLYHQNKNRNRYFFKAPVLVKFAVHSSYPQMILYEGKDRSRGNGMEMTKLDDL